VGGPTLNIRLKRQIMWGNARGSKGKGKEKRRSKRETNEERDFLKKVECIIVSVGKKGPQKRRTGGEKKNKRIGKPLESLATKTNSL